ncbi:MAG: SdpI family protein [Lysobacterales bacterium]
MTHRNANMISGLLIALACVAIALVYSKMPETVATHWNATGEADGFSSRLTGALLGPGSALLTWLIMWAIPKISPKGFQTHEFATVMNVFQVVLVLFMLGVGAIIVMTALGYDISTERVVPAATGLLFIVLGNYLSKVRKNFFVGIRTPWTLASDEVWARTHRVAGYCFVVSGLALLVAGFTGAGLVPLIIISMIAGLLPVAYSFFIYRQIEGFDNGQG